MVNISESKNSAVVKGLLPNRSYRLGVAASTSDGISPFAYQDLATAGNSEFTQSRGKHPRLENAISRSTPNPSSMHWKQHTFYVIVPAIPAVEADYIDDDAIVFSWEFSADPVDNYTLFSCKGDTQKRDSCEVISV